MAKQKQGSVLGKYAYHVKTGFFFSLLALFLIFPLIADFQDTGSVIIWTGFVSGQTEMFKLMLKNNQT